MPNHRSILLRGVPVLLRRVPVLLAGAFLACAGSASGDPAPARHFTRVPAPDGIQIRRYNKTDGQKPGAKARVVVNYRGTLDDGAVFDSSLERHRPAQFRLDHVIPCWTEALTRLRVGEKAQVICPPAVAYGSKGSPPDIPSNARLTFEVELLGIQ